MTSENAVPEYLQQLAQFAIERLDALGVRGAKRRTDAALDYMLGAACGMRTALSCLGETEAFAAARAELEQRIAHVQRAVGLVLCVRGMPALEAWAAGRTS